MHPPDDDIIALSILETTEATQSMAADCGIAATPLIIGGEKAFPKEFPHMVSIVQKVSAPTLYY